MNFWVLCLYIFVWVAFLGDEGEVGGLNWWSHEYGIFGLWDVEILWIFVYCVGVVFIL